MKDLQCKLTFSWNGDTCTVTDAITSKSLLLNIAECSCTGQLDKQLIMNELNSLIEAFNSYDKAKSIFMKNPTAYRTGIVIRDTGHFMWDCVEDGHYCTIKENKMSMHSSFDVDEVLKTIYQTYSVLSMVQPMLRPKVDIVRRIADCKLLVWVYNGTCIAVAEENVQGMAMSNALINGEFYPALLVDTSRESNECNVFDFESGECVFSCPVDNSVTTYYKPVEDLF